MKCLHRQCKAVLGCKPAGLAMEMTKKKHDFTLCVLKRYSTLFSDHIDFYTDATNSNFSISILTSISIYILLMLRMHPPIRDAITMRFNTGCRIESYILPWDDRQRRDALERLSTDASGVSNKLASQKTLTCMWSHATYLNIKI